MYLAQYQVKQDRSRIPSELLLGIQQAYTKVFNRVHADPAVEPGIEYIVHGCMRNKAIYAARCFTRASKCTHKYGWSRFVEHWYKNWVQSSTWNDSKYAASCFLWCSSSTCKYLFCLNVGINMLFVCWNYWKGSKYSATCVYAPSELLQTVRILLDVVTPLEQVMMGDTKSHEKVGKMQRAYNMI